MKRFNFCLLFATLLLGCTSNPPYTHYWEYELLYPALQKEQVVTTEFLEAILFDAKVIQGHIYAGRPLYVRIAKQSVSDHPEELVYRFGTSQIHAYSFRDTLLSVEWVWGEKQQKTVELYRNEALWTGFDRQWAKYTEELEHQYPTLPPLRISRELRRTFVTLFDSSHGGVFGYSCGFSGTPPEQRLAILELLKSEDYDAIRYILRGDNPTGRVYAAEALYWLDRNGYEVAESDWAVINTMRSSKSYHTVCYGCIRSQERFSESLIQQNLGEISNIMHAFEAPVSLRNKTFSARIIDW